MMKFHFREVLANDRGKGYFAIDLLCCLAYLGLAVIAAFLAWTVLPDDPATALIGFFQVLASIPAVHLARLTLRAVMAWRDSMAHTISKQASTDPESLTVGSTTR